MCMRPFAIPAVSRRWRSESDVEGMASSSSGNWARLSPRRKPELDALDSRGDLRRGSARGVLDPGLQRGECEDSQKEGRNANCLQALRQSHSGLYRATSSVQARPLIQTADVKVSCVSRSPFCRDVQESTARRALTRASAFVPSDVAQATYPGIAWYESRPHRRHGNVKQSPRSLIDTCGKMPGRRLLTSRGLVKRKTPQFEFRRHNHVEALTFGLRDGLECDLEPTVVDN